MKNRMTQFVPCDRCDIFPCDECSEKWHKLNPGQDLEARLPEEDEDMFYRGDEPFPRNVDKKESA